MAHGGMYCCSASGGGSTWWHCAVSLPTDASTPCPLSPPELVSTDNPRTWQTKRQYLHNLLGYIHRLCPEATPLDLTVLRDHFHPAVTSALTYMVQRGLVKNTLVGHLAMGETAGGTCLGHICTSCALSLCDLYYGGGQGTTAATWVPAG